MEIKAVFMGVLMVGICSAADHFLKNKQSGKCVGIAEGSSAENALAVLDDCIAESLDENWAASATLRTVGTNNYVHLINKKSGKCLAVELLGLLPILTVVQETCISNDDNQLWTFPKSTSIPGCFRVKNFGCGECVGVLLGLPGDGTPLVVLPCSSSNQNQLWKGIYCI